MTYQHISIEQKDILQYLLNLAHPPKISEIAKMFNKDTSSIYREMKRGDKQGKYNSHVSKQRYIDKKLKANSIFKKILNNYQLEKYILKHLKLK